MKWLRNNGRWLIGNVSEQPTTSPREGDEYVETTFGKIWRWIDGVWRDVTGHTIVDSNSNGVSSVVIDHVVPTPTIGVGTGIAFRVNGAYVGGISTSYNVAAPGNWYGTRLYTSYNNTPYVCAAFGENDGAIPAYAIGNARGFYAADLQQHRTALTQVASGLSSAILAGAYNTASGIAAVVLGGLYAVAARSGEIVNGVTDYAQGTIQQVVANTFTHNTTDWYSLGNTITLRTNTVVNYEGLLVGTTSGTAKTMTYKIAGVIKNAAGTTTLLANTTTTLYTNDANFEVQVTGNDVDDTLVVAVRDTTGAADTVRWGLKIHTMEVLYA